MNRKNRLDITEKNNVVASLIAVIDKKSSFLLVGHKEPDEDCVSSLAALALLLKKFKKNVSILLPGTIPQKVNYLVDICLYNRVEIYKQLPVEFQTEVIFILDTPKPSMIDGDAAFYALLQKDGIIKAEIDHHLATDAEYCGDEPYRFVTAASSAAELVGYLCMHIWMQKQLLKKYDITELLTRNLVLSILTGISGDVKNGIAINQEDDLNSYSAVSRFFEELLQKKTHKDSNNYATLTDIYDVIQSFSETEHVLYKKLMEFVEKYPDCNCLILDEQAVMRFTENLDDYSVFVDVIKIVTDSLAAQTKRLGITAYWDRDDQSNMVQIKVRCDKTFQSVDLRNVITMLDIKNGGGHPGAIAIRYPKETIKDLHATVDTIRTAAVSLISAE